MAEKKTKKDYGYKPPSIEFFEDRAKRKQWRDENLTIIGVNIINIYQEVIDEILKLENPFTKEDTFPIFPRFKLSSNNNTATRYLQYLVENGYLTRYKKKIPKGTSLTSFGKYSRWYYQKRGEMNE